MRGRSGFTLTELLVVLGVAAVLAALFFPGLATSHRASNERAASIHLKTIASAEADFHMNDRDGNGVTDFWTGDLKGLYTMTSALELRELGTSRMIRLIELEVAASDADGRFVPAGGLNRHLEPLARPGPRTGYWIVPLERDRSDGRPPGVAYRQDTGGSPRMGACHHLGKFGFCAVPASRSAGKYSFIINENNSIFRCALDRNVLSSDEYPPGLDAVSPEFRNWPSDLERRDHWGTA